MLRKLDLQLENVSAKGISALSPLEKLREFYFYATNDIINVIGNTLYNLCLQLLPQLHVIGYDEADFTLIDRYTGISSEDYEVDFKSLPTPTELSVRQLLLNINVGAIPKGVSMPKLTSLCMMPGLEDFRRDPCFFNVTELGLMNLGMHEYLSILSILGQQIKRLLIAEDQQDLLLDLILRLCPHLEELHISECPKNLTFTSPLDPDSDLQNLKVIRIELMNQTYELHGEDRPEFSPGVLVQLLKAPNLCQLKLCLVCLTKEEAEAIVHGVKQGQMLQKLKSFHFHLEENSVIRRDFSFNQELIDRYDWVLDNMVRHCLCFYDLKKSV